MAVNVPELLKKMLAAMPVRGRQAALADRIGVTQPYISRWVNGAEPDGINLLKILEVAADLGPVLIRTLAEGNIAELVAEIPHRITLSAEDLAPSPTRPGEAIWEQQVRNITSHKASPGNFIHDGKLVTVRGGFRLPPKKAVAN